jgi:hypothetical protein
MTSHRRASAVGLSVLALALVGGGCGGGTSLKQHNEAIDACNSWTRTAQAADNRTTHVFSQIPGLAGARWRAYIRLQREQDAVVAKAWRKAPDYVHRIYRAHYRAERQRSAAFVRAARLYLHMSSIPAGDVVALRRALDTAHRASQKAFRTAKNETRVEIQTRARADKYANSLKK